MHGPQNAHTRRSSARVQLAEGKDQRRDTIQVILTSYYTYSTHLRPTKQDIVGAFEVERRVLLGASNKRER